MSAPVSPTVATAETPENDDDVDFLVTVALEVAGGCDSFAKRLRDYGFPGGAAGHDLMARKLREAASKVARS